MTARVGSGLLYASSRAAIRAAQGVAEKRGINVADHVAEEIVAAVLGAFEETVLVRQCAMREHWGNDHYREEIRTDMRRALYWVAADRGVIPVDLPVETLAYRGAWQEEISPGEEWSRVEVTLTMHVRVPEIDREAAVRAGVFNQKSPYKL